MLWMLSKVASLISGGGISDRLLIDAELEWMTEDRFELSGTSISCPADGRDETHYASGWLCQYWAPDSEEPKRAKISPRAEDWSE